MAANIIPDKLIDYALFLNGDEKLGTGDVSLPDLEAMTETVKVKLSIIVDTFFTRN